ITMLGTPPQIWSILMKNEPSIWKNYSCNICGCYAEPVPVIEICEKSLRKSFSNLEKLVDFCETLRNVSCIQHSCPGTCTVLNVPNFHVFINIKTARKCFLYQLPKTIQLQSTFRLAGAISLQDNIYVVYCPVDEEWLLYDSH
ncbi:hypothetical protein PV326_013756, partial [Microctonus aethiopoides]